MTPSYRALAVGVALLSSSMALHAQQTAEDVSKVSLIAETTRVTPGQTILLGLHFDLEDPWHIYWDGRNDTGFPPTAKWTAPEGVTIGPMLWPAPHRHKSAGNILDHVYEGQPTVLVPVTLEPGIVSGTTLNIKGEIEWLVCDDICLPGFGPVSIELTAARGGNTSPAAPPTLKVSDPIGLAASRLPQPVMPDKQPDGLTLKWTESVATIGYEGATELAFYPAVSCVSLVSMLEDGHIKGDTLALRLASAEDDLSDSDERRLIGVLEVKTDAGTTWHLIDYGSEGLRKPADSETISRVRDRVERQPS